MYLSFHCSLGNILLNTQKQYEDHIYKNTENTQQSCHLVSPGHVDVSVPGSTCNLAEGDPDTHSHHHGEGDHPSNHIARTVFKRKYHQLTQHGASSSTIFTTLPGFSFILILYQILSLLIPDWHFYYLYIFFAFYITLSSLLTCS